MSRVHLPKFLRPERLLDLLRRQPVLILFPSLLRSLIANRIAARDWTTEDYRRFRDDWAQILSVADPRKLDSLSILYQDSLDRIEGLESKGIGILQGVSIVAAGAFVALTGPSASVFIAALGLIYLTTAGIACGMVLLPRKRFQLTLDDLNSDSTGYPDMAASVKTLVPTGIRISNLVTSAIEDLLRGLLLTAAAIVTFVWLGHTILPSEPHAPRPVPSISTRPAKSPSANPSATPTRSSPQQPSSSARSTQLSQK